MLSFVLETISFTCSYIAAHETVSKIDWVNYTNIPFQKGYIYTLGHSHTCTHIS